MEETLKFREYLRKQPKLRYLFFELTDSCNLSCLHCGSNACPGKRTFLPFDVVHSVLGQVARAYDPGQIMICLTGGEPLLHPDFCKIVRCSKKLGFSCGFTTNGVLIDREMARKLVASGVDSVGFSLDGLEESHDWFRNRKGAFEKVLSGINALLTESEGRLITQITTVVHKKNIHQLEQLYHVVESTGVDSWRPINIEPIGRAKEHEELLLSVDEHRILLDYIKQTRNDPQKHLCVTYGCSHYLPPQYDLKVRDHNFICGSGLYVASILCNGDIYGCLDIERRPELVQGNVLKDQFVDVWENRFGLFRSDRTEKSIICATCEEKDYCQGDSFHTWDFDQNKPRLCLWQQMK